MSGDVRLGRRAFVGGMAVVAASGLLAACAAPAPPAAPAAQSGIGEE